MDLNKTDLIEKMAEAGSITKKAAELALNGMISAVEESLAAGGKVTLSGFGTWVVNERKARKGRNPKTGDEIAIPASKAPAFKVGARFKASVK